ncbi:MAG: hypothetical protein ABEH35_02915 [Haloarculaceae archaeon]
MAAWFDRADDLLYDGESVVDRVAVGDGGVVVTSHRVLAFTPESEGPNYRAVERPNVTGVTHTVKGDPEFLQQGVKAGIVGGILIAAGQTISLDSMVSGVTIGSGARRVGVGGMFGLIQSMLDLLAQLDELMRLFGGLALALAAVVLAVYLWSRESLLVIGVSGDEDVELPAPDDPDVATRIEQAILPGDAPPDAVGGIGSDSKWPPW